MFKKEKKMKNEKLQTEKEFEDEIEIEGSNKKLREKMALRRRYKSEFCFAGSSDIHKYKMVKITHGTARHGTAARFIL